MISTKIKFYILRKHVLQNFPNFIIKSFSIVQRDKISERNAQLNFSSKIAFVRFSIEIKNKTFTKKKKKECITFRTRIKLRALRFQNIPNLICSPIEQKILNREREKKGKRSKCLFREQLDDLLLYTAYQISRKDEKPRSEEREESFRSHRIANELLVEECPRINCLSRIVESGKIFT